MYRDGFEKTNIGDMGNDFKKRLVSHGEALKLYSRQIFKNKNFNLKATDKEWLSFNM